MACTIDYWETKGEEVTQWTPCCLTCGWYGGDGTREEAEGEAKMHERGERHPWQFGPGEAKPWSSGEPGIRHTNAS